MSLMGDGLSKMAGGKLENILEKLTKKRIFAVLLGAGVTAVIQSSSATTVMVVGFTNAQDFYKQIAKIVPDMCLVDLMLPGESGNEIVRKLRKNVDTKKLPVIMVTAKTTDLDLVKGIEDGAGDYIKKPFSVMELISRVKALLRRTQVEEVKQLALDRLVVNNEKHEAKLVLDSAPGVGTTITVQF